MCPGSAGQCPDTAEEPEQLTSPILPIISTNKLYWPPWISLINRDGGRPRQRKSEMSTIDGIPRQAEYCPPSRIYHRKYRRAAIPRIITNSKPFKRRNISPQRLIYAYIILIHPSEIRRQFDSQSNCPLAEKSTFIPWNGAFSFPTAPKPSLSINLPAIHPVSYTHTLRISAPVRQLAMHLSRAKLHSFRSYLHLLVQWFPTWCTRTPRGTNQDI